MQIIGNIAGSHAAMQPYSQVPGAAQTPAGKDASSQFDQISISGVRSESGRFQIELVSRLSQEVRTATTTGTITELRDRIQRGDYQIDPAAIARKMLSFGEGL